MYIEFDSLNIAQNIFAHRKGEKPKETLEKHSNLTKKYLDLLIQKKNLTEILDTLFNYIPVKNAYLLREMFFNAVYLHDLGKNNSGFQRHKMGNLDFEETTASSNHSYLSAKKFIRIFEEKIEKIDDELENYLLLFVLYNFAYQISKHHGRLESFESFIEKTKNKDLKNFQQNLQYLKISEFEFYILSKLLFSLLVSSDYYATTEYMADLKTENFGLFNIPLKGKLNQKFNDFKNSLPKPEGINILRSKMLKETEEVLAGNFDKNIFYLEAPTGSGKTITSINLALKLLEKDKNLNKLFYIFPFNTLVEQTKKVFENIFEDLLNIEVINSITPIKIQNDEELEEEESKYEKSYLNRLFFHNPVILTTHIALFKILFGLSKEDNYPLWQLANSVIILDEIQSYDNKIWWHMIEFFQKYAKNLNLKIIIMSATLPKLDTLLENPVGFVDLIKNRSNYFENSYFKERVKLDFSLLKNEIFKKDTDDDLRKVRIEKLFSAFDEEKTKYQKFLFEFIKKNTAREIYNLLKEKYESEFDIYELTGDDNKAYREYVISETKKNKKIIVVATQVIEAGVDIDMDIGFKNISTIDSEEQFLGRINRNCQKKNSKAYFFYLDSEQDVYKEDNRLEFNLRKEKYKNNLINKNFQDFYSEVLDRIFKKESEIKSGLESEFDTFKKYVGELNYKIISDKMTLIKSQNFIIFFPFQIDIQKYEIEEFKNIDSSLFEKDKLDGEKIWNRFKKLNEIKNFTQREIEKSKINSLMQFFIFNITKYDSKELFTGTYDEEIGGIYYIKDYEDFITEDLKFKRKEFIEKCKDRNLE